MHVKTRDTIDIALAADSRYFCGLFVTACSISKYASKDFALRFNILDGGIRDGDWSLLEKTTRAYHPNVEFNRLPVNDEMFANYPAWHGNKMAYARLILPSALKDIEWVIYCDVDFTWMRDISELWGQRDDKYAFIGTKDGARWTLDLEEKWFAKHGYQFDREQYFCSGLCFMNLKRFREENLIGVCEKVLEECPDIQFPDQAALNIATWGKRKLVSQKWQRFIQDVTEKEIEEGVVIHHAGEVPWKKMNPLVFLSDMVLVWHRMNAEFRHETVWRSLRRHFSPLEIIWHRGLVKVFRCKIVHMVLKKSLSMVNHIGVYDNLEMKAKGLGLYVW